MSQLPLELCEEQTKQMFATPTSPVGQQRDILVSTVCGFSCHNSLLYPRVVRYKLTTNENAIVASACFAILIGCWHGRNFSNCPRVMGEISAPG